MADRPIIFTGDSVRAILAGRKTQSRRVARGLAHDGTRLCAEQQACPYGAAGSRLWVRETWAGMDAFAFVGAHDVEPPQCVGYRADESALIWSDANRPPKPADTTGWNWESPRIRWRSPIHMPRWASRLTLEILSVRVERVQAISEADARAEGFPIGEPVPVRVNGERVDMVFFDPRYAFAAAWDAINGRRAGCSWADNPFVWCLRFRRVEET